MTSVWSATDAAAGSMTLTNGGLTVAPGGPNTWAAIRSSISKTSGKLYIEIRVDANTLNWQWSIGLANSTINIAIGGGLGKSNYSCGMLVAGDGTNVSAGFTVNYTSSLPSYQPVAGVVFALAVDFAAGNIWLAQDNTWSNGSNPATASLPIISFTPATVGALFAAMSWVSGVGGNWTLCPDAATQKYAAPAGFSAWDAAPPPPTGSVWSASDAAANGMTLTNGGLTVTWPSSLIKALNTSIRGSISKTSGKLYVEFLAVATAGNLFPGLANSSFDPTGQLGLSNYSAGIGWGGNRVSSGFTSNYVTTIYATTAHVIGLAVDLSAGSLWYAVDNVWVNSSNPAAGALPIISFVSATVGALFPAFEEQNASTSWTLQSTVASQTYAPPAGFSAWDGAATSFVDLAGNFAV